MLISLIKCINDNETKYKYLPLEYCCDKMRLNPMLNLTSECDENNYVFCDECEERWNPWADCNQKCGIRMDSKTFELPHIKMFRQVYDEDDFPVDESISIKYSPHCGEKINISVVGEVDITNLVKELENKYIAAREKYDNCDSIKQRKALYEEMKKADNEYEDVFRFGEFKYNIKDVKWHGNS